MVRAGTNCSLGCVVTITQVRVGEVGGNSLGLYGGIFSPHGKQILAHGYQGAFHLWRSVSNHDDEKVCLTKWSRYLFHTDN